MSAPSAAAEARGPGAPRLARDRARRDAWPLAALLAVAAALRLSTISLQSLWFDEAYTPVHVLHAGLGATLHAWRVDEHTPPLWYLAIWVFTRAFGTGVIALRLPSALFGIALVGVGFAIGRELGSRRTAIVLAAIIAFNPLFVWYSQEARSYSLYALIGGVSLLALLRARRLQTAASLAWWAAAAVLALLTHLFAVFLVAPEALLLLHDAARRRDSLFASPARPRATPAVLAVAAVAACGAPLVPWAISQAGHGTQWIGRWALGSRLIQIPGSFLLGANGAALGHGLLLASALPSLAALALLARRAARFAAPERAAIGVTAAIGAAAIALPLLLAVAGADYLAPRNTIADFVPLSAALAVILAAPAAGRAGIALAIVICAAGLAVVVATDLDARLQRGDWHGLAGALAAGSRDRAIVTVEDGAAPLEYYLPGLGLRYLSVRSTVRVREIDLVGFAPLRTGAARPPRGFTAAGAIDRHGLLALRFVAPLPRPVTGRRLRDLTITVGARATSEALVPAALTPATPP